MKKGFLLFLSIFTLLSAGFAAGNNPQIVLSVQDVNAGFFDQTKIYFDSGLVNKFTTPQDVAKILTDVNTLPLLYSFTSDGYACSLNGYGNFTASTQVMLGVEIKANATYNISVQQMLNFDPTTMILLEDKQLNVFADMRQAGGYNFQSATGGRVDNRFVMHFSYPPQIVTTDAGCNNNTGEVSISEDSSIIWTECTLVDSNAQQVATYQSITGNFSFSKLPAGAYTLQFLYGTNAPIKTANVIGNQINPVINPTLAHATVGENIVFNTIAVNATIFNWDFGDGSSISDVADPSYAYNQAGTYTVMLTCNNSFGCSASTSTQVTISQATGISQVSNELVKIINGNKQVEVILSAVNTQNYLYELYNISGQRLTSAAINSADFTINLSAYSSGVYILHLKGPETDFSKKILLAE